MKNRAIWVSGSKPVPLRGGRSIQDIQSNCLNSSAATRGRVDRLSVLNWVGGEVAVGRDVLGWDNRRRLGHDAAGHSFSDGESDHVDLFPSQLGKHW